MAKTKKLTAEKQPAIKVVGLKKQSKPPKPLAVAAGNDNDNPVNNDDNKATSIEASAEIFKVINELRVLEDSKKRIQDLVDECRQKVMDFMHLNHTLKKGQFTLATWKCYKRKSVDLTSLKKEMPDLYDYYLKESSMRVFKLC